MVGETSELYQRNLYVGFSAGHMTLESIKECALRGGSLRVEDILAGTLRDLAPPLRLLNSSELRII